MFNQRQVDADIISKNGFTFKRKRQDPPTNDYPLQQVRKEEDQITYKNPPIQINLKQAAPAKERNQSPRRSGPPQDENIAPNKKIVQNTKKGKENGSKKPSLKEKPRNSNDDYEEEEKEDVRLVRRSDSDDSPVSKEVENISNQIEKLPQYPDFFHNFEFDKEIYEKENPYKRIGKMVTEICAEEEVKLKEDWKNYGFFLKMGISKNLFEMLADIFV